MCKKSYDEMVESGDHELCPHCPVYGVLRLCEGVSCKEAYQNYLNDVEDKKEGEKDVPNR